MLSKVSEKYTNKEKQKSKWGRRVWPIFIVMFRTQTRIGSFNKAIFLSSHKAKATYLGPVFQLRKYTILTLISHEISHDKWSTSFSPIIVKKSRLNVVTIFGEILQLLVIVNLAKKDHDL